jgi:hypothetical protein
MPCSVILGYEKLQSGYALRAIFSTPHFFAPVKYFVFSLSGTKKRQLPRTLCDIGAKIEKWLTKYKKDIKIIKYFLNMTHCCHIIHDIVH